MEIKWLQPAEIPKISRSDKYDVIIEKDTKTKTRLKITIENTVLDGMTINPRMMVGIAEGRLYFKGSDTEGFSTTRTEFRTVFKIPMEHGTEKYIGEYVMHRGKDDLLFIKAEENGIEI